MGLGINPFAHQVIFLGLDDPHAEFVAGFQVRLPGEEHIAVDLDRKSVV